jgi:hypothetical protein
VRAGGCGLPELDLEGEERIEEVGADEAPRLTAMQFGRGFTDGRNARTGLGVGPFLKSLGIDAVLAAAGGGLVLEQIDQGNEGHDESVHLHLNPANVGIGKRNSGDARQHFQPDRLVADANHVVGDHEKLGLQIGAVETKLGIDFDELSRVFRGSFDEYVQITGVAGIPVIGHRVAADHEVADVTLVE